MDGDARSFRVALVTSELLNARDDGVDVLGACVEGGWGVIGLPATAYPDAVAQPLLEQAAEQAEEFHRHRYRLVVIGAHPGLAAALARYDVPPPPSIDPSSGEELRAFLDEAGA